MTFQHSSLTYYIPLVKSQRNFNEIRSLGIKAFKGAEATCVEIASEMKKYFKLKDMLNFNVL